MSADTLPLVTFTQENQVDSKFLDFLQDLSGPVAVLIKGTDSSRCRVLTTLLHGNEPSGVMALHQLLVEQFVPAVDFIVIVASVSAALAEPIFSNRQPAGQRDLNRCFHGPYDDMQGQLAKRILNTINQAKPEAVIDLHNTSGDGPAFGVSHSHSSNCTSLVGHFCQQVIISDLDIGSLMEVDFACPIVTVEAGGAAALASHKTAYDGMTSFAGAKNIIKSTISVDVLPRSIRLEANGQATLGYGSQQDNGKDITLLSNIEALNYGTTDKDTQLGWLGAKGLDYFLIRTGEQCSPVTPYFYVRENRLYTKVELRIFMATTRIDIAQQDCLLYFVPESEVLR